MAQIGRESTEARDRDLTAAAFDALLAAERAQVLYWACEFLRVDGELFRGSFHAYPVDTQRTRS